ncbi:uncharacterized protein LOC129600052 [Paramacrobiotus metropolitanus]|uniref:uncharacterized protein LOC129600052 n=1 Tax=Paramacrobiotus metropolitanus TaxID=2943436 RepID=UPI0024463FB1|nr:uncharacterized protein LOC129600052 [Paramacrobiotus metropolitanus]
MLVIGLLSVLAVVSGFGTDLEKDCNNPTHDYESISKLPSTVISFPFQTDLLTKEECIAFATIGEEDACRLVLNIENCDITVQDYYYRYHAVSRTYLKVDCYRQKRSDMRDLTRNISRISPNRAVTILLVEKSNTVHSEVAEPIRQQIIELSVESNTSVTTRKVYEAGILPKLLRFEVQYGSDLSVNKQDFSRMPEVRMICFMSSIIDTLERYTFMDLPHLKSLMLEKEISSELARKEWLAEVSSNRTYESKLISINDVQKVRRLHCDCSFAWFRNFLQLKPHLIAYREAGEVFIVGNYLSPYALSLRRVDPQMMSVDCARELTYNNTRVGKHFAYNTYCNNLICNL